MAINMNISNAGYNVSRAAGMAFAAPDAALTHKEPHYHGFCRSCCHPAHSCCCHVRTCRKEAKELLVVPQGKTAAGRTLDQKPVDLRVLKLAQETVDQKEGATRSPESTVLREALAREALAKETLTAEVSTPSLSAGLTSEIGHGSGIIGGCCCVHLSIEYMPSLASAREAVSMPVVVVSVTDSEATTLTWQKTLPAGSIYQIRENIIVTKPGAYLTIVTRSAVARVRWCEIFSC